MSYSCNTDNFPRPSSYADARRHFDKVKPWRGDSERDPRPIGTRSHKHKTMRMLADGSIAFRLYRTDCVTWHPDGTMTVQGWASISTTAFIDGLVPRGISHQQGGWTGGPTLHLRSQADWDADDWRVYRRSGTIIRCSQPVKLQCRAGRWHPVDPDTLQPFSVPTIDRKAAREASRRYNLPTLNKVLTAVAALSGRPAKAANSGHNAMGDIMTHLERGEYASAIALMPRSYGPRNQWHKGPFGNRIPPKGTIPPGFLRRLRNHIYNHEGVITRVDKRILTPAEYRRYVADSKRFD